MSRNFLTRQGIVREVALFSLGTGLTGLTLDIGPVPSGKYWVLDALGLDYADPATTLLVPEFGLWIVPAALAPVNDPADLTLLPMDLVGRGGIGLPFTVETFNGGATAEFGTWRFSGSPVVVPYGSKIRAYLTGLQAFPSATARAQVFARVREFGECDPCME